MDMTGEQRIAAPRDVVWAALNDPEVLKECIPGCKTLEKISDTAFKATATLAIGPVKATFAGAVTLAEIDPPNAYVIRGEGNGGVAGFAKGEARVQLTDDGSGTILTYTVKADVGGKIAQLGGRLIDSTAKKLSGDFFRNFSDVVAPPVTVETETESSERRRGLFKRLFGGRKA
jgi:uncharacterized protein